MMLKKWDYKKHEYLPYEVPDTWDVALYCDDMDRRVNCANCGAEHRFGDGYVSQEIQNCVGLGYSVCSKCAKAETARKYGRHGGNT